MLVYVGMDALPNELIDLIFQYLDHPDWVACQRVCRRWKNVTSPGEVQRRKSDAERRDVLLIEVGSVTMEIPRLNPRYMEPDGSVLILAREEEYDRKMPLFMDLLRIYSLQYLSALTYLFSREHRLLREQWLPRIDISHRCQIYDGDDLSDLDKVCTQIRRSTKTSRATSASRTPQCLALHGVNLCELERIRSRSIDDLIYLYQHRHLGTRMVVSADRVFSIPERLVRSFRYLFVNAVTDLRPFLNPGINRWALSMPDFEAALHRFMRDGRWLVLDAQTGSVMWYRVSSALRFA